MPDANFDNSETHTGPSATLLNNIRLFSRYAPPLRDTGFAVLGAAVLPAFLCFVVWQLSPAYDANSLKGAVVRSLAYSIPILFFAMVLSKILRAGGAAENHFGWSPILCDGLLKTINKLILFCVPLKFLYTALESFDGGVYHESLGRLCFIASMMLLAIGLWETGNSINRWRDSAHVKDQAARVDLKLLLYDYGVDIQIAHRQGRHSCLCRDR